MHWRGQQARGLSSLFEQCHPCARPALKRPGSSCEASAEARLLLILALADYSIPAWVDGRRR